MEQDKFKHKKCYPEVKKYDSTALFFSFSFFLFFLISSLKYTRNSNIPFPWSCSSLGMKFSFGHPSY